MVSRSYSTCTAALYPPTHNAHTHTFWAFRTHTHSQFRTDIKHEQTQRKLTYFTQSDKLRHFFFVDVTLLLNLEPYMHIIYIYLHLSLSVCLFFYFAIMEPKTIQNFVNIYSRNTCKIKASVTFASDVLFVFLKHIIKETYQKAPCMSSVFLNLISISPLITAIFVYSYLKSSPYH